MCVDPLTALTLTGAGISAAGNSMASRAAVAESEFNAKAMERQSSRELRTGAYNTALQKQQNDRQLDSAMASYLSSGFALAGSPANVLQASATEASLDEQAIKYDAAVRASNAQTQAGALRANARSQRTAGAIDTLTPIIGGASKAYTNHRNLTIETDPKQRTVLKPAYQRH